MASLTSAHSKGSDARWESDAHWDWNKQYDCDDDAASTHSGASQTSYTTTRSAQSCPATFGHEHKKGKKTAAKPAAKGRSGITSSGIKPNFTAKDYQWDAPDWHREDARPAKGGRGGKGQRQSKGSSSYTGGKAKGKE